jgi:cysteine dioxygenase
MSTLSLAETIQKLKALPSGGFKPEPVLKIIESLDLSLEDSQKYYRFEKDFYTRNLVCKTKDFEVLFLCWEPGQITAIHDHASQGCWMTVLDGIITSENYDYVAAENFNGTLHRNSCESFVKGNSYYIDDTINLHLLKNPIKNNKRTVTLHLYSKPFSSCTTYNLEKKITETLSMSYHSIGGRPGKWAASAVHEA